MPEAQLAHALLTMALILGAAHAVGWLFSRMGQPRGLGEILGGLLLGPSALSSIWPDLLVGRGAPLLEGLETLGLAILMFITGFEARTPFARGELRRVQRLALGGTLIPLGLALVAMSVWAEPWRSATSAWRGPAAGHGAFELLLAGALAVTSVPILSRILLDLGALGTSFARVALGAAVLGNLPVYAVVATAIGLAAQDATDADSLRRISAAVLPICGAIAITIALLPVARRLLPRLQTRLGPESARVLPWLLLFVTTGLGLLAGVPVLLSAFAGGLWFGMSQRDAAPDLAGLRQVADLWLVPLYFGLIGTRLDLIGHPPGGAAVGLLLAACCLKGGAVFATARLQGLAPAAARDYGFGLNARGGPGLVFAALGLQATILTPSGKTTLVLLAIATSLIAGLWLSRSHDLKAQVARLPTAN